MRASRIRAVAAVAVVVVIGVGLAETGCGGSDEDDRLARTTELADIWGEGWSETDPDAVASVFTEDGQYTSFLGFTDTGREQIAHHVAELGPSVSDLVRSGDVSETSDGTFTWTVEARLNDRLHRGMAEMELEGDLVSRLWWAQDPEPVGMADESPSTSTQGSSAGTSVCPPEGCSIEEARRVAYVEDATFVESVDVFSPVEPGPWPVVVLAHGITRDRSDVEPWAREVASRGAVAVTVGYPDDPPFVEAIEHLGCSVRFARSIAEDHGGDPAHVTFVGHSLGAAMGAVVALDDDLSTEGCLATEGSTAPEALVGYEGPYNLATISNEAFDLTSLETSEPDVWRAVNPYSNIGQHPELVVRLIHGIDRDADWYDVAPEVSENYQRALLDAGYDVELVMIDGATHVSIGSGSVGFDETIAEIVEVAHA